MQHYSLTRTKLRFWIRGSQGIRKKKI